MALIPNEYMFSLINSTENVPCKSMFSQLAFGGGTYNGSSAMQSKIIFLATVNRKTE